MEEPMIQGQNDEGCNPIDILLAEDNDADVKIALRAFKKARLRNNVYVVNDGVEALDFVFKKGEYENADHPKPGIILLDINMPKLNGFEVLEKLKSEDKTKCIPVIMLTSSRNEEDVVQSYGNGASSYIPKPVNYDDFVKVVDSFNFYWHIVNKLPDNLS